jgi:two-component SAPR family response regulator
MRFYGTLNRVRPDRLRCFGACMKSNDPNDGPIRECEPPYFGDATRGAAVVEGGRVSLDESHCWLDVWSLERRLERLERHVQRAAAPAEATRDFQEVVRLYAGPLLGDSDQPWAVAPRERLRRRVLRTVEAVGRARERSGDLEGALAACLGGLEIDDLAEGLYQRAMQCYGAFGRHAEALALYQRCRRVLRAQLDVEPSSETQAVAAGLREASTKR